MQRYIRIRFLVFIPSISTCSTDFSIFPPQRIINFVAVSIFLLGYCDQFSFILKPGVQYSTNKEQITGSFQEMVHSI